MERASDFTTSYTTRKHGSDGDYIRVREFSHAVFHALVDLVTKHVVFVLVVLAASYELKVFGPTVLFVAVLVVVLVPIWAFSDKSPRHKYMHRVSAAEPKSSLSRNTYTWVITHSPCFVCSENLQDTVTNPSYAPKVAYFKPVHAWNLTPFFHAVIVNGFGYRTQNDSLSQVIL